MSMRILVFFVVLINILLMPSSSVIASQSFLPSPNEVISLINQYRQQIGIPALSYNALLASLAQSQSNYQAEISTITHTGPGGTTPQQRAAAAGYGDGSYFYLSEIIYGGTNATPDSALAWWQNSSLHNSIMLDTKYTEIGAGVATDGVMTYFTAVLGGPTGGGSAGVTQPPDSSSESPDATDPASVIMPVIKSTPGTDGAIRHTVLQGQTLWTLAAIYETTTDFLIEINQLESSFIFPGDELLIRPAILADSLATLETPVLNATPGETLLSPTPANTDQNSPRLGTPYSLVVMLPIETQIPGNQVDSPINNSESISSSTFFNNSSVNLLLVSAAIIFIVVVIVSSLIQYKPGRPSRDDSAK